MVLRAQMRVWGNQFGAAPYPVQMRPVRPDILSKKSSADMPEMSRRSATGDCRINQELGPVIMVEILTGDCMDVLPTLEAQSVQCCVTSPPYWGLRDYGTAAWEGGDAGCEHGISKDNRAYKANQGGCTNWNDRKDNPQFSICKCGARRIDSQLGLESTPEEYLAKMVAVFRTVLDPFGGSGTTGKVALELGRKAILIELNPAYVELARKRTDVTPAML